MKTLLMTVLLGVIPAVQAGGLSIQCGIPPLVSVVRAVGGDRVEVRSLMDSRQDPHTWMPSPKAVAAAGSADLFFTVGLPFEGVVAGKLAAVSPGLRVVNAAAGIETGGDPHVWMSLVSLSAMAGNIERALAEADPEGASFYRERCSAYQKMLAERHAQLKERLRPLRGRTFFVYHPVFGFFANDYGLNQGVVEAEGKGPSPKDLLALVRRAREEQVQVIFVQPQFSQRPAQVIAERIGGRVIPVDPLGSDPVEVIGQAAQYLEDAYADRS